MRPLSLMHHCVIGLLLQEELAVSKLCVDQNFALIKILLNELQKNINSLKNIPYFLYFLNT